MQQAKPSEWLKSQLAAQTPPQTTKEEVSENEPNLAETSQKSSEPKP